ncbi:hypothetical protein K2X30_09775 [bacterium]|jgi:hypothetical protein|nr:hypothetical protein [bacterium]
MFKLIADGKVLGIAMCLFTFIGMAGCNDGQEIKDLIQNTNRLQIQMRSQASIVPYRLEQHQVLKEYFAEIANLALSLKRNSKFAETFNAMALNENLNDICGKVLISKSKEWAGVIQQCTRNGYFLCAEEVRAYPEIVSTIREKLNMELQKKFDQAEQCRMASG